MSNEIPVHYVKQYEQEVRLLQQQMTSRLRDAVRVETGIVGDRDFFDQFGAVSMSLVTNRHGDRETSDTPHSRRMVTMDMYETADWIDRKDERRVLNNPLNSYTQLQAAACNRQFDDTLLAKFDAAADTGNNGGTSVIFDTAFGFTEADATNFGVADLRTARGLLEAAENLEDDGMNSWHVALSSNQRSNLLAETEMTSSDFAVVKALVDGKMEGGFMGFNFIKTQQAPIAANIRDVYFWVKQSMLLAIGEDVRSSVDRIPAKRNSILASTEIDTGATRMDEKGVVRCLASEA